MAQTQFETVVASLAELCGEVYTDAVCNARAFLTGEAASTLRQLAREPIDFYPRRFQDRLLALLPRVGQAFAPAWAGSAHGATTETFREATKREMAPLSTFGWYRCGEGGRLYFALKSEHYHAALGHGFPGYDLLERARRLGIPNATHNNTRGHITRLLEEELVRTANGLAPENAAGLNALLASREPEALNRVLNLETGSLAVEAALKMILARFYRMQADRPAPPCAGRTPVILVVGDNEGHIGANYHGTTILTQVLRGMWSELRNSLEDAGALQVRAVRPNNMGDLEAAFAQYDTGATKIAGFFHEIVMMNYGALLLTPEFLQRAYALCQAHDVPVVADEIQSCAWGPDLYLFREYGLRPSFVALGKGLPGGEYPASRLLFAAGMDNGLPQFGALVTNGQEELASLAYLVTMRWAQANARVTRAIGEAYAAGLRDVARRFSGVVTGVAGWGHLSALLLRDLETAKRLAARLVAGGLDISAQTYKADCPPALLTKLPLTAGYEAAEFVVDRMAETLSEMVQGR
ncbi:MAG: aminotransferase class III-fold pyridoxal phosphate-dependent enzyme [Candidatus Hydrogenedentes bacterium]|nr:aminotransferase class III-fold pyridoxal phosphate-dependent enzyme [Candidatus Hydrogenedentota bacterium]